jgi:hypothetical protein
MAGWILDIIVEYLVRVVMRIVQLLRSRPWPTATATVTSSSYVKAGFGCDIVNVSYKYRVNGESYAGVYKKPLFLGSFYRNYVTRFPSGTELIIRVKPGNPSISIMEKESSVRAEEANVQSD